MRSHMVSWASGVDGVGIINVKNVGSTRGSRVYAAQTLDELLGYMGYEGEAKEQALKTIEVYNEKGLYAAGNCLGHRFGPAYSTPSAGASMGMAMPHGRVLGKIVAAL